MKSTAKVLAKIEVCRSLLDGVWSDEAAPTIEWIKGEIDSAFLSVLRESEPRDKDAAVRFIATNTGNIKASAPDNLTALFLVSSITQILGDLENTNKYRHVEGIVDASYALEEYAEKDSIEQRRLASAFANNLETLMDN